MEFQATRPPAASHRTDCFVLFRHPGDRKRVPVPDPALARAAAAALKAKEFGGKAGETLLLHGGRDGRRLLLAGLGSKKKARPDSLRRAAAVALRAVRARNLRSVTMLVPEGGDPRSVVEGAGLAGYVFDRRKSKRSKPRPTRVRVAPESGSGTGFTAAVREAKAVVEAVSFARDLGNEPGNVANAAYLARRARELAGRGVTVRIHDRAAIRRLRMGAFAGVAQGSANEPRLIEFRYRGGGRGAGTIALVGKGVTFDTGGISIKPGAKMEDMKFDMCGGAAVFGVIHLLRALQPKLNVHALVPATDNMPDGRAYRPGDILKARNGKTIEIGNTDAEGRLLLCDALAYAAEKKPECIVDLATLTGACVVALGDAACGLFSNDARLSKALEKAAAAAGEDAWPMPLFPRYTEMMKGSYADLRNVGGRWGGACTAAAFLQEFVAGQPWAHLDIAGVAWTDRDQGYHRKGATGYGVRLLWEWLRHR